MKVKTLLRLNIRFRKALGKFQGMIDRIVIPFRIANHLNYDHLVDYELREAAPIYDLLALKHLDSKFGFWLIKRKIFRLIKEDPDDIRRVEDLLRVLEILKSLGIEVDFDKLEKIGVGRDPDIAPLNHYERCEVTAFITARRLGTLAIHTQHLDPYKMDQTHVSIEDLSTI